MKLTHICVYLFICGLSNDFVYKPGYIVSRPNILQKCTNRKREIKFLNCWWL